MQLNPACFCVFALLGTFTILFGSGCERGFPQSAVFRGIALKGMVQGLVKDPIYADESSIVVSEYVFKDCEATLDLDLIAQRNCVSIIAEQCKSKIRGLNGHIRGYGGAGDFGSRSISYEAGGTAGEIRIYAESLSQGKMRVLILMFEARK